MKRTRLAALAVFLLCAVSATAQVTIVHGDTLSGLIQNLYGGDGITLDPSVGHEAHFGQTEDLQQFTSVLQKTLQSRSVFPIPSAVGVYSYAFDEATGTYKRVDSTLGPILAERATTTGKGSLTFQAGYSFADFNMVDGRDRIDLTLEHCKTVDCVGIYPDAPIFKDVIKVSMNMKLKSQALTTSVIYGASNSLDVGLLIPYIRNDLTVLTDAQVVYGPGSTPTVHRFNPLIETPGQFGTAHAIGLGDIVVRGKYRVPKAPFDFAVLGDAILPTGDKENFLGTGSTRVRAMLIASHTGTRFSPHANVGYEYNTGNSDLSSIDYRIGTEWGVMPRLTLVADLLGTARPSLGDDFTARALKTQKLVGRNDIDFALGAKWRLRDNALFVFNILQPANDAGIRPETSVNVGIQVALQ